MNSQDLLAKRLLAEVEVINACWLWKGALEKNGYACFSPMLGTRKGHRIMWMLANGKMVPDGLQVAHKCENKNCINPEHLKLATNKENAADKQTIRRPPGWTTVETQLRIQSDRAAGRELKKLAKDYGLHWRTIQEICKRDLAKIASGLIST